MERRERREKGEERRKKREAKRERREKREERREKREERRDMEMWRCGEDNKREQKGREERSWKN